MSTPDKIEAVDSDVYRHGLLAAVVSNPSSARPDANQSVRDGVLLAVYYSHEREVRFEVEQGMRKEGF